VRIDDGVKREILARTDIGAFIGGYVALRKRGNDLVGLCPFHGEKTPSFHVHPDRGFFKCFGCQKGGDVISFVMELEGLTFPDALRVLAKRAGIEVEEETSQAARMRGEKEQLYAANELAAAFFHRTLRMAPAGEIARAYAEQRGLTAATIESFKLGYSPPEWDGLVRELSANGHDLAIAAAAGLVKAGQRGYYDFYRSRLMIPTYATTGEVVAFGGRALDDSQPKYLNTTTTPVYTKGRGLYALNVARRNAAARESLVVVEGYLDCIALHQAGFTNAVASLGTAFTPEQAAEIRKYAERVFLCFDADAAGSAATLKSIDVLSGAGCTAFVVQLPPGEDPDTYIRTHGSTAFAERLDTAAPWVQFKLDREIAEIVEKRLPRGAAARTAESLVRTLAQEEWDRWRVYIAKALDLSVDDLRNTRFVSNPASFAPRPGGLSTMVRYVAPAAEPPPIDREILAALVDEPALVAEYADRIPPEAFRESRYREIYRVLCERAAGLATVADVYAAFGEDRESVEILAGLQKPDRSSKVRFQDSASRRAHLDRVVEGLMEGRVERRWRELDLKIDEAFASGGHVSHEERDEHRLLGEDINKRRKRRLGTK
jgi:DNA primase catalytic core